MDPLTRRRVLRAGAGLGAMAFLGVPGCTSDPDESEPSDVGARPGPPVPRPVAMVRTAWSEDPWTLGSYSYLPVGATPQARADLAVPIDDVVHFAGEALDAADPATVHGALASGATAAAAIIRSTAISERIVVVGAGIAGAAAAARLVAAGHEVVVVEARDRTGGRVHTLQPEGWPVPVELGASWIHDADGGAAELAAAADALGVDTEPFAYDAASIDADGRPVRDDLLADAVAAVGTAVDAAHDRPGDDVSLAAAIDASGAASAVDPTLLAHVLRVEIATEYGADADELSARWGLYEGAEGDDRLVVGGYGRLVDDLLAHVEVRLRWPVIEIARNADSGVVVTGPDGEVIDADRVVVTVPLGVLKAGVIRFDPPLPDGHVRAIDTLGMGLLDKVWLRWDEPWWTEPAEVWTRVGRSDDAFVEWVNLAAVTGDPVLVALVGGSDARRWTGVADEAVIEAAVASLQRFRDAGW